MPPNGNMFLHFLSFFHLYRLFRGARECVVVRCCFLHEIHVQYSKLLAGVSS